MLSLQNNEVIYNNFENAGAVESLKYVDGGFEIDLPDGLTVYIPEEDCTSSEREVFTAFHEYYKDTGGVPPSPEIIPAIQPPTTEERLAAVEEAIAALMGV